MKLSKDEIATMEILKRQGETNQQIAQRLVREPELLRS
jgi:hypothetical protein